MFEFEIKEGTIAGILIKMSDEITSTGWTESPMIEYVLDFSEPEDIQAEALVNVGFSNFPSAGGGGQDIARISNPVIGLPQFVVLNQNTSRNQVCVANARDADWVDNHDGLPVNQPALNLRIGNGTNRNGQNFQGMGFRNVGNENRYIFGFFRALTLPITIYIKEWSGANQIQWERVNLRIGWLGNDPKTDGRYIGTFTSQSRTNGALPGGGQFQILNALEQIQISAADVPVNFRDKIHWIELEGETFPNGLSTGDSSDIWFKVCSAQGNPLPTTGFVNVLFILDYSGSIAMDSTRKTRLLSSINNAIDSFVSISNLYNDSSIFRYALRVIGAPSGIRDLRYNNSKYHAYKGDGQSDNTTGSRFFTNSQSIISFIDNLNSSQLRAQCASILNDTTVRYAYTPIWRSISEAVGDFQQASNITSSQPGGNPAGDINIMLLFSDGDETVGGYVGDSVEEIMTRREAIIKACKRLIQRSNLGTVNINLTSVQKMKIKAEIISYLNLTSTGLSNHQENLLIDLIYKVSQISLTDISAELPTIERDNAKVLKLWNGLISKEFNIHIKELVDRVKANIDVEPDPNTLSHRVWSLLKNYKIGGQFIVAHPNVPSDHPIHSMHAVSGDPTNTNWLQNQIKQSIINQRWCHTACRNAI